MFVPSCLLIPIQDQENDVARASPQSVLPFSSRLVGPQSIASMLSSCLGLFNIIREVVDNIGLSNHITAQCTSENVLVSCAR